jgi:hypothetical protein
LSKERVTSFYSCLYGWNMFDAKLLTHELEQFLSEEGRVLETLCGQTESPTLLIEVGCGYGRYMRWSIAHGFSYLGCDLVPWLIDMGQIRLAALKKEHPDSQASLHTLSIERLAELMPGDSGSVSTLVFFPFNCFGNLSNISPVMETLARCADEVFISTFRTDEITTTLRKAYYANCGYSDLVTYKTQVGSLVSSKEGLHAIAYSADYLERLFARYGFELNSAVNYGTIGVGYHFSPDKSQSAITQDIQHHLGQIECLPMPVTLSILQDNAQESHPGELLEFENYDTLLVGVTPHELYLECNQDWAENQAEHQIVKLELMVSAHTLDQPEYQVVVAIIKQFVTISENTVHMVLEPYGDQVSLWPLMRCQPTVLNPNSVQRPQMEAV